MRLLFALLIAAAALCSRSSTMADIFRWDTGQLIPGTENITPGPGVALSRRHLEYADLADLDLRGAVLEFSTLTDADLSGSNLTRANLLQATLTDANLTGVILANARLTESTLNGANLSGADLTTASLRDADLSEANLSGANLSSANLNFARLTSADLSQAVIRGVSLQTATYIGLTQAQFESTASFQAKNLGAMDLSRNNMNGWDLSGQNLAGANLSNVYLRNANLRDVNLAGATLNTTRLRNSDLSGANLAGAGLNDAEVNGANFSGANLSNAYLGQLTLTDANLSGANLAGANLTASILASADLSETNLAGANLRGSTLTLADLSGSVVTGAVFQGTTSTGFTQAHLQSTASYQAKDLQGIWLSGNNLTGWDLSGQNLTGARLDRAMLANSDLRDAVITGANLSEIGDLTQAQLRSTANFQAGNLDSVWVMENDFTNWDFSGINLTGANLRGSGLTNANFSGAIVTDAGFENTTTQGFTQAQLQSTASYHSKDLHGIGLSANDLTGWDFSGQNLTRARFGGSTLTHADFSGAVVTGAGFWDTTSRGFTHTQLQSTASYQAKDLHGIILSENDLTGWDLSGQFLANASFFDAIVTNVNLTGADLRGVNVALAPNLPNSPNVIPPDGRIDGLSLTDGDSLVVRNYAGELIRMRDPIPVVVEHHLTMDESGRLQLLFDEEPWHSVISFSPRGIPVVLNGTLELDFADGVDANTQCGRTLDLFDWTGVNRVGEFIVESPYLWDLSRLYSTGEVRLTGTGDVGDYNLSGIVDQGDLDLVLINWGSELSDLVAAGWTNDIPLGPIDQAELDKVLINWGRRYMSPGVAAVPEPATWILTAVTLAAIVARIRSGARLAYRAHHPAMTVCQPIPVMPAGCAGPASGRPSPVRRRPARAAGRTWPARGEAAWP
jgi:uncharacterized protein YjbI with pentapeptide repeats